MITIGERIKESRKKKEITQQELSEHLNVSRSAISNWEVGRNYPDLDSIVQLCDLLEISLDQLLREDTKMVKKVSEEQRKGKKRELLLKILIPSLVLSLIIIGTLIYNGNSAVNNYFNPKVIAVADVENETKWENLEFERTKGNETKYISEIRGNEIGNKLELISDLNNQNDLTIKIIDNDENNAVEEIKIKAGEKIKLKNIEKNKNYRFEIKGEKGNYLFKLF